MSRRKIYVIAAATILLLFSAFVLLYPRFSPGYTKVEGFRYVEPLQGSCDAVSPMCGYCPGEIINKECYVKR